MNTKIIDKIEYNIREVRSDFVTLKNILYLTINCLTDSLILRIKARCSNIREYLENKYIFVSFFALASSGYW